jgi:hypothetical protein
MGEVDHPPQILGAAVALQVDDVGGAKPSSAASPPVARLRALVLDRQGKLPMEVDGLFEGR